MDEKELQKRIDAANNKYLSDGTEGSESDVSTESGYTPVDIYQTAKNARYEANKAYSVNGSSPKVLLDLKAVLKQLAAAHKKAKSDSELYLNRGDTAWARYANDQYMEEQFLPAVQSLIDFNSVDEVVNNKQALSELDKYATLDNTSGSGYTLSFIRSMYPNDFGKYSGTSDSIVVDKLRRMNNLLMNDRVRAAVGIAKGIKKDIDNGKNIASEEDYETITKVALY